MLNYSGPQHGCTEYERRNIRETHNSTTSLLKIHYIQVSETKKITSFGQIDYRKKLLELSMEQMWYKLIEKHET